ncbi:hypothetical protein MNBD_GAMMA07-581 [hydrothermal vent metagenome]|uniref:POTRA domain-containing protein n=1 Tax=hydrothermal vent metagenome TaxID=652676 RepID=A0A3B0WYQ3_9ZZZZ
MLMLCNYSVDASVRIQNIKYQGNVVTDEVLLNNALYIKSGDELIYALVEKSKQSIMDIGMFKSVHFYVNKIESNEYFDETDSLVDIVFVVTEKIYFLIVPKVKIDDDRFNYGAQLRWDNIFGLNHKMRASVIDRGSTLGVKERRDLFKYFYPNVNDTAFNFDFLIASENFVDEENLSVINREDNSFRFAISRWLTKDKHNRGWFSGGSFSFKNRFNDDLVNNEKSDEISAVTLGVDVGYKNINTFKFNRGGKAYGYKLDWSHDSFGSETQYAKHLLYYRSYYRFRKYPISNLNVQFQFGHSNADILGDKAFRLGSRKDLRGYENNRFSGNTLLLMNFEFMFPHVNYPAIRYVTFVDIGNTYDALNEIFSESTNIGAGFGLRWKISTFVNVNLRADVGYGFTDDTYKFSFGTRHAF